MYTGSYIVSLQTIQYHHWCTHPVFGNNQIWLNSKGSTEQPSTTHYDSLNDSEDAEFIVVWVHCGWQVFNVPLVSVFFPVQAFSQRLPLMCAPVLAPDAEVSPCSIWTFRGQLSSSASAVQLWLHTVPLSKWVAGALREETELVASASVMK